MRYQTRIWGPVLALLLLPAVDSAAESGTLKAAMSWSGHGQVLQIGLNTKEFLGVFEGILYIETSEGALDEAFMECTFKQQLHMDDSRTSAHGNCLLVQSSEDNAFAEFTCEGQLGACRGRFSFTEGTGRFEGIEGSSELIMRSPLRHLAHEMSNIEDLAVDNGIAILPKLSYRLKGGNR